MLRRRNIQQGVFTAICKTRWSWFTTGSGLQPVVLEILWKLMQWWTQKVKSDFEPPCNNICKVRDWQREPTFKKKKRKKAKMSFRKPGEVILKTASRKLIQENSICVEELRWYYQIFIFWFIWIVDAVFLPYILCFHVCLYMFLINN